VTNFSQQSSYCNTQLHTNTVLLLGENEPKFCIQSASLYPSLQFVAVAAATVCTLHLPSLPTQRYEPWQQQKLTS
jgi:hypothetical protein